MVNTGIVYFHPGLCETKPPERFPHHYRIVEFACHGCLIRWCCYDGEVVDVWAIVRLLTPGPS